MTRLSKTDFTDWNIDATIHLNSPINCEKEYKKLISIFNRMSDEEIELNLDEANRIFNNDWAWGCNSIYNK